MDKHQLIKELSLEPHPLEGGYFYRTYTSDLNMSVPKEDKPRRLLSTIYYLLTDDSPKGYLHRNKSDIIHFFQCGSPITYFIIHPDGSFEQKVLGNNLAQGQQLQLTVKGGCWKASELEAGEFGLISEAVSPGFEYEDMELAQEDQIKALFPSLWDRVSRFVK